jgi:SAM-dependent methyltransferase
MTDPAADAVIDLYRRHGRTWAELRGEWPAEGFWLDRFCDLLPAGAKVLDVGCGSGVPIARELVRRGFDLTGVDAAPEMLSLFRRNLPDQPAVVADMRQLSLCDCYYRFSNSPLAVGGAETASTAPKLRPGSPGCDHGTETASTVSDFGDR